MAGISLGINRKKEGESVAVAVRAGRSRTGTRSGGPCDGFTPSTEIVTGEDVECDFDRSVGRLAVETSWRACENAYRCDWLGGQCCGRCEPAVSWARSSRISVNNAKVANFLTARSDF